MIRMCLLALLTALATAGPDPEPNANGAQIAKVYGTVTGRDRCTLTLSDKNVLAVKMEKARPPKKDAALPIPEPTGAAFVRPVTGDFSATVVYRLKTDLAKRPNDTHGVTVGLRVEYPTGAVAEIAGSFGLTLEGVPPFKRKLVYPAFASATKLDKDGKDQGKSIGRGGISGLRDSFLGPIHLRVRAAGKKVVVENRAPDGQWEEFDAVALKEAAGDGKLILSVKSWHGDNTEVVIETFEVK